MAAFEEALAAYFETRYGIAINSGTSALHLALLAANLGPGDEVITIPFTFVATVAAIGQTNCPKTNLWGGTTFGGRSTEERVDTIEPKHKKKCYLTHLHF